MLAITHTTDEVFRLPPKEFLTPMDGLGTETVSPVTPHETVFVRGGGGSVQKVPWNVPGFGKPDIMGLGAALTDEQIQETAARIAPRTKFGAFDHVNAFDLAKLLAQFDAGTRKKLAAAIIAEGGDASLVADALERAARTKRTRSTAVIIWSVLSTVSGAASAYHGYKRNQSVGWAIGWFVLGSLFPVITPVIAVAQGFGKPKKA